MSTTAKLPGSASQLPEHTQREGGGFDCFGSPGIAILSQAGPEDVTEVLEFTHNELGVPAHGNHRPVHRPQQVLHDDLHMALRGALRTGDKSGITPNNTSPAQHLCCLPTHLSAENSIKHRLLLIKRSFPLYQSVFFVVHLADKLKYAVAMSMKSQDPGNAAHDV